jgi:prepilin-type processing-associated H-X9-DG protein
LLLLILARPHRYYGPICTNNLKQIGLSFREWAGDNDDKFPTHFAVTNKAMMQLIGSGKAYLLWQTMSNEMSNPKILLCPEDRHRTGAVSFTENFSDANISYFFNLDVSDDGDPQMLLAGDDNFVVNGNPVQPGILNLSTNASIAWTAARHHFKGNVALADGSVQSTTSAQMQQAWRQSDTTNRLVIP